MGKNGKTAVATMVERMTRFTLHLRIDTRRSRDVAPAVTPRMRREFVRSITWDQGKEMSDHADLARDLGIRVYFADAHSPWQRGTNENSNGISRRHLPKGTVLDPTPAQLHHISRQFAEAFRTVHQLADEPGDVADACVTLAVHSGIASADVITCAPGGPCARRPATASLATSTHCSA